MFRSRLVHAATVVAVLITGWFVLGDRALAIQDSEDKVWFGPVGFGIGQGVRINVYTTGTPATGGIAVPDTRWEFNVQIFNVQGVVVQERRFRITPGAIASFEVSIGNPNDFPADRLGRRTLRAEVVGIQPPPEPGSPPPDPDKYAATLEVYSLVTGYTSILIGNPDELPAAVTVPGPEVR